MTRDGHNYLWGSFALSPLWSTSSARSDGYRKRRHPAVRRSLQTCSARFKSGLLWFSDTLSIEDHSMEQMAFRSGGVFGGCQGYVGVAWYYVDAHHEWPSQIVFRQTQQRRGRRCRRINLREGKPVEFHCTLSSLRTQIAKCLIRELRWTDSRVYFESKSLCNVCIERAHEARTTLLAPTVLGGVGVFPLAP